MSSTSLIAALAALTTLSVIGCGSSDRARTIASTTQATETRSTKFASGQEITVSAGKPLQRAIWIRRGDAICGRVNAKLSSTTVKTPQDLARLLPQAAAYDRAEAIELSRLVPPPSMRADWQQVVTGLQKFGEFSAKAAAYIEANNSNGSVPAIATANRIQSQLVSIAKRDGFKVCSLP
jgi:hypothetical protein